MNFIHKFFGIFLFKKQAWVARLSDYFSIKTIKIYWLAILLTNILLWVLAWLIKRGLNQDLAILHYNITFGIDYLAPRNQVFFVPLIALVLIIINGCVSLVFFKKDSFLLNLLLICNLAINFIVGLGLYSIYLVNFVKIF